MQSTINKFVERVASTPILAVAAPADAKPQAAGPAAGGTYQVTAA